MTQFQEKHSGCDLRVSCRSSAQLREGGDRSVDDFVSDINTNRAELFLTHAMHTVLKNK